MKVSWPELVAWWVQSGQCSCSSSRRRHSFFFFFFFVSVAIGLVGVSAPAEEPPGVMPALPLASAFDPAGVVAWVEPEADGELAVCAEAIVAPPSKSRAAVAVSPVFLNVILFSPVGVPRGEPVGAPAGPRETPRATVGCGKDHDVRSRNFGGPLKIGANTTLCPRSPNMISYGKYLGAELHRARPNTP